MDYSGEQGHEPRRGAAAALVYGVVSKLDSGLVPPCTALLLILHYNSDLHEAVLVPYRTSYRIIRTYATDRTEKNVFFFFV